MPDDPKPEPVADPPKPDDGPKEPETVGELIESIVGVAIPKAIADARKSWAKDLADLLDGGGTSDGDPVDPPTPVADPTPVPVSARKFKLF